MTNIRTTWSEEASDTYQRIATIAVPHRAEQIAALLTLLPFSVDDEFRAIELGSGEGRLAAAILEAFPNASITALDGSDAMRSATRERLEPFGDRSEVLPFDLLDSSWWERLDGSQAVLSSLVVHHLDGPGKKQLFHETAGRLNSPGVLLIADIVHPGHPRASALYAGLYDRVARQRSEELVGSDAYFRDFQEERWNYFRYPEDDDWDKPSRLDEQLTWLAEAGFDQADCFWLQAGHAIYGGYTGQATIRQGLTFERAMEIATEVTSR